MFVKDLAQYLYSECNQIENQLKPTLLNDLRNIGTGYKLTVVDFSIGIWFLNSSTAEFAIWISIDSKGPIRDFSREQKTAPKGSLPKLRLPQVDFESVIPPQLLSPFAYSLAGPVYVATGGNVPTGFVEEAHVAFRRAIAEYSAQKYSSSVTLLTYVLKEIGNKVDYSNRPLIRYAKNPITQKGILALIIAGTPQGTLLHYIPLGEAGDVSIRLYTDHSAILFSFFNQPKVAKLVSVLTNEVTWKVMESLSGDQLDQFLAKIEG